MNHELIMLREVKRMHKLTQSLTKEAKYRAIKSYASYNVKNGTVGQIEEISRLVRLRDECLLFCAAVSNALSVISRENRVLLVKRYINNASLEELAEHCKIQSGSVYGKLFSARLQFKKALDRLGYGEQWLRDNYSHVNFLKARLDNAA